MSEERTYEYTNGEVTILWRPGRCIHSGNCVRGLPLVFDPKRRPWIDPLAAASPELVAQVAKCPSGALEMKAEGRRGGESE